MLCQFAARQILMANDQLMQNILVFLPPNASQLDHIKVAQRIEKLHLVKHISYPAAHTRREIASRLA